MKTVTTVKYAAYPTVALTDMKPGDVGVMTSTFPGEVVFCTHAGWFTNNDRVWLKDHQHTYTYHVRLLLVGDSVTITRNE